MSTFWHEDFIVQLASVVRPKVYVELGIFRCALFNRMIPFAEQLVGVDMNAGAGNYMNHLSKTQFFHGTTDAFAEHLRENPLQIDMLFIDADHSKEAVLQDFHHYFPFVAQQGIILLHDSHPGDQRMLHPTLCGNAYEAIDELSRERDSYEMMTIPVSPGLTLCRKRNTQLSWHEQ